MACCTGCKKSGGSCGGKKKLADQGGWRFGTPPAHADDGGSSWLLPAAAVGIAILIFSKKK